MQTRFSLSTRMDCDCDRSKKKKQTLTIFGGENGLVINCFLRKSHHVVYILWGGDLSLFALLVEPQIRSEKGDTHLLAALINYCWSESRLLSKAIVRSDQQQTRLSFFVVRHSPETRTGHIRTARHSAEL
jgi:hypothetical protein